MPLLRATLIWAATALVLAVPLVAAALSPLLEWRQPVYIAAGFAGVTGMALLLIQPLLIAGLLPGLDPLQERRIHRWTGAALVLSVILHVAGLWLTSPPDVIDALLFTSPTPFTPWGVIAMWALFATAILAVIRRRLRLRWRTWRIAHTALALVIVTGSVVHAILITGTMETVSKITLCTLALALTLRVAFDPGTLKRLRRAR
ncbi:ferric reductase-like transmembrane domain-containing protein [Roseovarius sp.]|uniref:ferric reductase-like transmembrane domain-containing protein n=1 Tax=Roseovarius sp. TaxID=1486281 RepID=UPI0026089EF6|nr:ferric reductase-like transmembrane domain-containing protein [Roseovarius sp.]MDM8167901.1 ferric reductase-like transmembrane domain-containing protein [Roseovarius sp.]